MTNSNHYLELLPDRVDKQGRPVAELSTDKHRGREKRKVHYVLDREQGIATAEFEDPTQIHADALIRELYREGGFVSPTQLVENLGELNLNRKAVRSTLSRLRREHGWTDTSDNKWGLTWEGKQHVEKLMRQEAEDDEAFWKEVAVGGPAWIEHNNAKAAEHAQSKVAA